MFQPEGVRVSTWTRLWTFTVGKYKAVQLSIERRSFEHKLETIVRAALAHQSGGLPAGNGQYKLLTTQAESICIDFTSRWNIDPHLLDAQIPAIRKLKTLADPPPKPNPASLGFSGSCGCNGSFLPDGNPGWPDQHRLSPDRRSPTMILELIVAAEASVLSSSWIRRSRMRRRQILLGRSTSEINLPFVDQYLKQQTTNPTRLQTMAARKLAAVCRHVVHTQAFELLVLKLIQSASRRFRRESEISKVEVIL